MRRILVGGGAVVALLASGAVAFGAIPSGDGKIYACYNNGDGTVRVKDDPATGCLKGWTALDWNRSGPQGERGPQGTQGPQGEPGPGSDGVNITLVRKTVSVPGDSPVYRTECQHRDFFGNCTDWAEVLDHYEPGHASVTVTCPEGTQSMGDGDGANVGQTPVGVSDQHRIGYTGWRVTFSSQIGGTGRAEVRCVKVANVTTVNLD